MITTIKTWKDLPECQHLLAFLRSHCKGYSLLEVAVNGTIVAKARDAGTVGLMLTADDVQRLNAWQTTIDKRAKK